jgi:hypothetical protein
MYIHVFNRLLLDRLRLKEVKYKLKYEKEKKKKIALTEKLEVRFSIVYIF